MPHDPALPTTAVRPLYGLALPGAAALREAALLLPVLAALLVGLGHPVQNLNEGLYARIPQEMLATGQWLVPSLDGLPYLEKPPLLYWVTAAAYALFGVHEWSARCAPVLGMALAIAAIRRCARSQFGPTEAFHATWIYATLPMTIVLGRTLLFDALFTGLIAWALVLLHEHGRAPSNPRLLRWSYGWLALAVLTKGLAALVIYGGVALAQAALAGPGAVRRLHALLEPGAVIVFFALAAPWHAAAVLAQPGFAWFYFVNEHLLRLAGTRFPFDYHTGPWWYHLPRVAGYAFPWVLLALVRAPPDERRRVRHRDARHFLLLWLLVPLAVFSLAGEKGEYYMMVAMPALALLLGRHAARLPARALALAPLGCAGALVWAQTLVHDIAPYRLPDHAAPLLFAACALLAVSIAACVKQAPRAGMLAAGACGVIAMALFSGFLAANADLKSARSIAEAIASDPHAEVFLFQDYENLSSLPFYLRANVGVVDSRSSDLWFGMQLEPDAGRFPDVRAFAARAARSAVWLVVHENRLAAFRESPLAPLFATATVAGRHVLMRSLPRQARRGTIFRHRTGGGGMAGMQAGPQGDLEVGPDDGGDDRGFYHLMTALVIPRPIGWISTISAGGVRNLAPYSYFNLMGSDPFYVAFGSSGVKDSLANIREVPQFVANIVSVDLIERMNFTSGDFPREEDEFGWAGLTPVPAAKVKPYRVGEAKAHIECEVQHVHSDGNTHVVLARVVHAHVSGSVWKDGRVDPRLLNPVCRLSGSWYASLGELVSVQRPKWQDVEGTHGQEAMPRIKA